MKQLFAFTLLIGVGLLLLTIISGMGGVFSAIAATWTTDQTAEIASGLSQVLWLGGIVTVMTLGYGLFVNMSKGGKGWSGSRQQQYEQPYQIVDAQPVQQPTMIGMKEEQADWYDFAESEREPMYR